MEKQSPSRGVDIFMVVLVVFLILKLSGLVAWSWFWVLAPLWIEVALWLLLGAVVATFAAIKEARDRSR
jgi:hypothetical protein